MAISWAGLFDPSPPGPIHIIFLGNRLLTYHHGSRQQTALKGIVSALTQDDGGWWFPRAPAVDPFDFRWDRTLPLGLSYDTIGCRPQIGPASIPFVDTHP